MGRAKTSDETVGCLVVAFLVLAVIGMCVEKEPELAAGQGISDEDYQLLCDNRDTYLDRFFFGGPAEQQIAWKRGTQELSYSATCSVWRLMVQVVNTETCMSATKVTRELVGYLHQSGPFQGLDVWLSVHTPCTHEDSHAKYFYEKDEVRADFY